MVLVNYAVVNLVQLLLFRLISAGTLAHSASIIYTGTEGQINLAAMYGEAGFVRNLLGLAIAAVGLLVLRSQGVATNVVEKLIDDKKNAELNAKDRYFRIEENEEEKENGNEVPNDADDLDTNENDNSLKN